MRKLIKNLFKDNTGATAIEYALIAGLISIAIVGSATAIGESAIFNMEDIVNALMG